MTIAKWILSLAVGGFLIMMGITKFTGGAHIFPLIEMKALGLGFPLADLFLVILPMTRAKFGAPLAVLPFLGAVVFHLSPLLGVVTPNGYAEGAESLDAALVSGSGFTAEHFTAETGPTLFAMAAVFLVLAIVNFALHRRDA